VELQLQECIEWLQLTRYHIFHHNRAAVLQGLCSMKFQWVYFSSAKLTNFSCFLSISMKDRNLWFWALRFFWIPWESFRALSRDERSFANEDIECIWLFARRFLWHHFRWNFHAVPISKKVILLNRSWIVRSLLLDKIVVLLIFKGFIESNYHGVINLL
jgi:hypothetical protein